jgi:ankyrin repeat protein
MFAAENAPPNVVRVLLDAGADAHARAGAGNWTTLMIAARTNPFSDVVLLLLDAGVDVTAEDMLGLRAWDYIQENEALMRTDAYWALNDRRFE